MADNALAFPSETETYDAARMDASKSTGYGCAECLRKGFRFVTDKWGKKDLTAYSGYCCKGPI